MELKSNLFQKFLNDVCKDIMTDLLAEMVSELSANAIFVMNSNIDGAVAFIITGAIVDDLKNSKFKYMPLHLVMEGFHKGSMGELGGTCRFTVRNVNIWMNAMYEKLAQINTEKKTQEDARRRDEESVAYKKSQINSCLYAAAYYWKISHCPMSDKEYDRLTLDKIVDALKKGYSTKELKPAMIL